MTLSDSTYLRLEAKGTGGSILVRPAILSLALALTQYPATSFDIVEETVRLGGTLETSAHSSLSRHVEVGLFHEINRIHDELLKESIELDADAKRALYANLWDLYS